MNHYNLLSKIIVFILLISVACGTSASADTNAEAMKAMVGRLMPQHLGSFEFKTVEADEADHYTISSNDGIITISGNNANSMAVGLNYYLKNFCHTTVGWYKTDSVYMPEQLPQVEVVVEGRANCKTRFFLNYCTYGYTMPWWKWADWERLIDWMALNGINMPLAITGQEAIWYGVWQQMGLTDTEIRSYFTGPAHLPWHRMNNIDRWEGPLPMEWIESQAELQQRILERERQLNMSPVLPAFAGHIPAELLKHYPEAQASQVSKWSGFAPEYQCTFLSSTDSLYSKIQRLYLQEQTRLYGTDHIYGIDLFNEVQPPSWDPDTLAMMAKGVYESVTAVDPDARWLQMGWMFFNDRNHWTQPRIKAYLQGVPQDRLLLLDYICEFTEIWKLTDSFYGQPYVWCYLGNFGGNTVLSGDFRTLDSRYEDVKRNGGRNMEGLGSTLEGMDVNPYVYEYVFDKAWDTPTTDDAWFDNLAWRRTGAVSPAATEAWGLLRDSVYCQHSRLGRATLTDARPCLVSDGKAWGTRHGYAYSNAHLIEAWHQLLQAESDQRDTYEFDLINLGRQALANYFIEVRDSVTSAYQRGDLEALRLNGQRLKDILLDTDTLLSYHPSFSLEQWISDARAMADEAPCSDARRDSLADYYEQNARTIITVWGDGPKLTEYANRNWADLMGQYYYPRWERWIESLEQCVMEGKELDEEDFRERCIAFERQWVSPSHTLTYHSRKGVKPFAEHLYDKYFGKGLSTNSQSRPEVQEETDDLLF